MEVWRPILGFEGRYEVSDQGRVRSLLFRSHPKIEIMRLAKNYAGYRVVSLGSNPRRQFRVHCLVLEAFVGPRPIGMQGCHNDSDKDNNALNNLRWDTPKGNVADRQPIFGEANPNAKITDIQKQEIIRRRQAGEGCNIIALDYGITNTRVSQITRAA